MPKLRLVGVALNYLFLSICSFSVFLYSFFQLSDKETDEVSGLTIDCGSDPYSEHHPLRLTPQGYDSPVECAWPWMNTTFRLSVSLFAFIVPFLFIFFGVIRRKSWVVWMSGLLCWAVGLLFSGVLIYDMKHLHPSHSWCTGTENVNCSYSPFYGMEMVVLIVAAIWFIDGFFVLVYAKKYMKNDFETFTFDYNDDNYYPAQSTFSNSKMI